MTIAIEHRILEYFVPVGFARTVEQNVDGAISFTIKYGEEEYQRTQHQSA